MAEKTTKKRSDFDLDFANGKEGETLVEELLTGGRTVEVKRDLRWRETGNLFIETECFYISKKGWAPSGLSVTKADYWAFVIGESTFIVPTQILRDSVVEFGRRIENRTPPNHSKGYLITPSDLVEMTKAKANAQQE